MKAKISIAFVLAIMMVACKKDKFTTKPQLSFTSVNTEVLSPNQSVIFTLHYTDREGDVQQTLFVQKVTKNCTASDFEAPYQIPQTLPKQANAEGDIQVRFSYGGVPYPQIKEPACLQNDTCVFRFALSDLEGNTSDTIVSPQLVIIKR